MGSFLAEPIEYQEETELMDDREEIVNMKEFKTPNSTGEEGNEAHETRVKIGHMARTKVCVFCRTRAKKNALELQKPQEHG